jgi:hypothetical protein
LRPAGAVSRNPPQTVEDSAWAGGLRPRLLALSNLPPRAEPARPGTGCGRDRVFARCAAYDGLSRQRNQF